MSGKDRTMKTGVSYLSRDILSVCTVCCGGCWGLLAPFVTIFLLDFFERIKGCLIEHLPLLLIYSWRSRRLTEGSAYASETWDICGVVVHPSPSQRGLG